MDKQRQPSLFETLTGEFGLSEREIVAHLTPMLADLSRKIGLHATLKFLDHYHGRKIYIPKDAESSLSALVSVMGKEVAAGIIEVLGGSRKFDVGNPLGDRFRRRMRAVKAMRDGSSNNEICMRFGVGHTAVKRWKQDAGLSGAVGSKRRKPFVKRPARAVEVNAHMRKMRDARLDKLREQKRQAFEMFAAGRRLVDIQSAIGVGYSTVKRWRSQYGAQT